jgi:hypothetical protein
LAAVNGKTFFTLHTSINGVSVRPPHLELLKKCA